eukprot:gene16039-biopygen10573
MALAQSWRQSWRQQWLWRHSSGGSNGSGGWQHGSAAWRQCGGIGNLAQRDAAEDREASARAEVEEEIGRSVGMLLEAAERGAIAPEQAADKEEAAADEQEFWSVVGRGLRRV